MALDQPNAFTLNDLSTRGRFDLGPTRWVTDDSVISLGATELVSYDLATGEHRWTVGVPGGEICAASFDLTTDGVGAVLSGKRCTTVTTLDTSTGKQVWSTDSGLDNPTNGNPHPAGTNGVSVTDEAVTVTSQCSGAATLDLGVGGGPPHVPQYQLRGDGVLRQRRGLRDPQPGRVRVLRLRDG